jgi:ABC-type transport system involved in multi-copper enzyme maturation permease subunit
MVGSVVSHELLLGSRRTRHHIFRRIYTGWMVAQFVFFYWIYLVEANVVGYYFFGGTIYADPASEFANSLVDTLVWQQFILLLLATPAFTAGAITDEKSRGTLQYLLAADLSPWEILLGKLIGRVTNVGLLALAALPIISFLGAFGGLSLAALSALVVVTIVPVFTLGTASLLASVWSRQTRDAVLSVYFCALILYLIFWATHTTYLFNPVDVLEPAWSGSSDLGELTRRLLLSALAWGSIGAVSFLLAGWRLRVAYLRQLEGEGRPKSLRWWRARRTAVSDEPIRWKERQVEGLAPLAALRRIPRWLGITAIFVITLASSVGILAANLQQSISVTGLWTLIADLKFDQMANLFGDAEREFQVQSIIALLVATLLVGLRCSGAITGERERQTWEALLLTPLPVRYLIRGKLSGIMGASYPYLLGYAIPAVPLSILGGKMAFFWMVLTLVVTLLGMRFVGAAGLWCSARAKSSWRSLLGTALIGYVGGFILYGIAWPVTLIAFAVIWVTLALVDMLIYKNQTSMANAFFSIKDFWIIGSYISLVLGFLGITWFFLSDAQKYVAFRERIRHWKEEPVAPRRPRRKQRMQKSEQVEEAK